MHDADQSTLAPAASGAAEQTDPAALGARTGAHAHVFGDTLEGDIIARGLRARLFGDSGEAPRIGRYVLVDKLGSGGMGVVYSAYDATLDRKVAIKFIHGHLAGHATARARFLREARAMARLSHPNVVQIHEAGEADGKLFLALEFVVGSTLRGYLAEHRDALDWREIATVFRAAGEGLAAAHAAGIVHRDFKPDNVLRTAAGAIKVADFGLAGSTAEDSGHVAIVASPATAIAATAPGVTTAGAVVGTLAYMAPEQHRGQPCDARADQFAFCVALFEALFGTPPFAGEHAIARAAAVIEGRRAVVDSGNVPGRVREIVERGLAIDAEQRWPSMAVLLEHLDRARAPRRRGAWFVGAGALIGVTLFFSRPEPVAADDPCAAAGTEVGQLAQERDDKVVQWASVWATARKDGCEAHRDGEISGELFDRRQACLDGDLATVRTSVELGASGTIDPASPSRCTDAVRLTAGPIPGGAGPERKIWIELREQVARAEAALASGDFAAVDAIAGSLSGRPDGASARLAEDLAAHAQWLGGRALRGRGEHDAALAALADAAARADASGDDDLRARALLEAVWVAGVDLYRADEARRIAALANGAIDRAGLGARLSTSLHEALGLTAMYEGRNDLAGTELELALAGTILPQARATLHANLATVRLRTGDAAGAVADFEQSLAQIDVPTNDDPFALAGILNNLGYALLAAGRPAQALGIHERSLALREQFSGPDSLEAANAVGGVGLALLALDRKALARHSLERALAIRTASEGRPEDLAEVRFGLARALDASDPRAIELASAALGAYQSPELIQAFEREAATVAAWLERAKTPR